ncbi:hypothetical protein V8F33_001870 [Rhypophila sp. PSN 637]
MTEITLQHRLQEVANLMLKIYQTLAEMEYLDPSWIVPSPHKMDDNLLAKYKSLDLDPALIHLFTLLPYVDNQGIGEPIDFFQGSEFFDARNVEHHLNDSRDPMYKDISLPPWRTALSRMGNHDSVIFYDVRRNMIAIQDHETGSSTDHVIRAWEDDHRGELPREYGGQGVTPNPYALTDETPEEMVTTEEHGNGYGGMMWRDAPDVLRDMLGWYEQLVETPGGGSQSYSWEHEVLVPLYKAAGWWPDRERWDGEVFLVAKTRREAARKAKHHAEEPLRRLSEAEARARMGQSDGQEDFRLRMEGAGTVDDEWNARWNLWNDLRVQERKSKELEEVRRLTEIDCPGGVCQQPDELPLWELGVLKGEYKSAKRSIVGHRTSDKKNSPAWKMRLSFLEKQGRILKRAVEEVQREADRMCSGKELKTSATEMYRKSEREAREEPNALIKQQGEWIERGVKDIEDLREWMKQLPEEGAECTKAEVEHRIKETEKGIETSKRRIERAKEMLETGVRPKGGLFWMRQIPGL